MMIKAAIFLHLSLIQAKGIGPESNETPRGYFPLIMLFTMLCICSYKQLFHGWLRCLRNPNNNKKTLKVAMPIGVTEASALLLHPSLSWVRQFNHNNHCKLSHMH